MAEYLTLMVQYNKKHTYCWNNYRKYSRILVYSWSCSWFERCSCLRRHLSDDYIQLDHVICFKLSWKELEGSKFLEYPHHWYNKNTIFKLSISCNNVWPFIRRKLSKTTTAPKHLSQTWLMLVQLSLAILAATCLNNLEMFPWTPRSVIWNPSTWE